MRIAVVIPALDEADQIAGAVQSASEPGVEVWVVDGGSTDATVERARALGACVISSEPGRSAQLRAGVERVRADTVVFLHADTRLPAGFAREVAVAFADPQAVGGAFRFAFDGATGPSLRLVEAGARLRARLGFPYGDQAIFARRSVLLSLGGIPRVPLMEDLDLVRLLRREGRFVQLRSSVRTSARRYRDAGVVRTVLWNTVAVAAWFLGVDRNRLRIWMAR